MPAVTKYIYVMQRVRKAHQDKLILDDVTLAFLPGAKIGVVGPNGAGKSTVLEIMAGLETISNGEAALAPGASVGILLQEPVLDPAKDVLGNVEEGVAPTRALLARFEELSLALGEAGPDEMDRLLEDYAKVQDAIEAASAWDLDAQLEMAMDALRLPPGDADVDHPVRRGAAPGRPLPAAAVPARPAPARRADQPPGRRERAVAGAAPGRLPGHGPGRHPRPLLPRQRRRLDPGAGPGPRLPV